MGRSEKALLLLLPLVTKHWNFLVAIELGFSFTYFLLLLFERANLDHMCCNPSFGLATKVKGLQGYGPKRSMGITSHTPETIRKCEGMNPHTPKATPTLGDGVPMESRNFKEQFQGSKLNVLWRFLYHWKALGT